MRYVYPALLQPDDGGYSVTFPDVEGAITCGDNLSDALEMAQDALSLILVHMEDSGAKLPAPTKMDDVSKEAGDIVTLVLADTDAYRRTINTRAVKKTLSIPQWMNEAAEEKGVNFSQVLQDALRAKLGIV